MFAPVICLAIANVSVIGNGLHFTAEWNCSDSRGVNLILYVLL